MDQRGKAMPGFVVPVKPEGQRKPSVSSGVSELLTFENMDRRGVHPSYLHVLKFPDDDPAGDLHLSPEFSEWLFFIRFWDGINEGLGTIFNQYDDDVLPYESVGVALAAIYKIQSQYLGDPAYSPTVIFGWTPEGSLLTFVAKYDDLVKGAAEFAILMRTAIELKSDVFCQL